jgi:hypothetical protein
MKNGIHGSENCPWIFFGDRNGEKTVAVKPW